MNKIKTYITSLVLALSIFGFSQNDDAVLTKANKRATDLVYKANTLLGEDNFVEAEMNYRKALSEAPNKAVGSYNLSHSYFKKGNTEEAIFRAQEASKNANTKDEKHRIFHNLGNMLMEKKACKEASEAFKNALRNNPSDEETRYNFALAKQCAEQQKQDGGGEDNKKDDKKEQEKDKKDNEKEKQNNENKDQDKDNKDDQGDKDHKDGEDKEDEKGKPKDDKNNKNKGDNNKDKQNQKPKPQQGQMSPQQIKNLLEAMQNQEQKVQQKMNAEKQKGAKVKTEKDW